MFVSQCFLIKFHLLIKPKFNFLGLIEYKKKILKDKTSEHEIR